MRAVDHVIDGQLTFKNRLTKNQLEDFQRRGSAQSLRGI